MSIKIKKFAEQKKFHDYDIRVVAKLVEKDYLTVSGHVIVLYNDKEYSTSISKSDYRRCSVGDEIEVRYNTKLDKININYKVYYYVCVFFMIVLVFYFIICLIYPPEDAITRAKKRLNR